MLYKHVFGAFLLTTFQISSLSETCLDIDEAIQGFVMDTLATDDVILVTSLPLRAECVVTCYNLAECRAVFYHEEITDCSLHSQNVSSLSLIPENGWVAFDLPANSRRMLNNSLTTTPTSTTVTSPTADDSSQEATSFSSSASLTLSIEATSTPLSTLNDLISTVDLTSTVVVVSTVDLTSSFVTSASSSVALSTLCPTSSVEATSSISTTTTSSTPFTLWLDTVVDYSSQFRNIGWAATQILGPYNVYPTYGDFQQAWAPLNWDQEEFIQVTIATALYISQIEIYETYNAGGVKHIQVEDPGSNWVTLFQVTDVVVITTSRIFSPSFTPTSFKTNMIKITTDCSQAQDWVELDAVKVTGSP